MAIMIPNHCGYCEYSTPLIITQQTQGYNDSLQRVPNEGEELTLRYLPVWDEIERLRSMVDRARAEGADWDDQEGQVVTSATATQAKVLLRKVALRAAETGKAWASPAVSATPDGGIHFSWLVDGNRVALTVFGPNRDIVCVQKLRGEPSRRELVTYLGAVDRIVQSFGATAPLQSIGSLR